MAVYKTVRSLSSEDAAYIAGLIDGEGTVTLTHWHRGENRRLVVSISSTELALLHFVKCVVGAGQITGKRTYKGHHTPSFTYQITNRQAMDLLKQVAVYLKSYKAARAELALEQYIRLTPRNGRYTLVQKHEREKFEQEFLRLLPKKIEASSLARGSYFSASGSDVGTFHVLSEAIRELGAAVPVSFGSCPARNQNAQD